MIRKTLSLFFGYVNLDSDIFNAGFIVVTMIFATLIYFLFKFNRSSVP